MNMLRNFCFRLSTTLTLSAALAMTAHAQPPWGGGDRGGSDRGGSDRGGSDRGGSDRGGRPSGGPPSFGGGGPPSGYGGSSGFRGGPPGGGPPGFGGGPPGGDRGSFDPSSFLDRLDRNGNGMLDLDEMEGPAQFMISRMQREDPSIRTDRPIPMSKIREGFEKMRSSGRTDSSRSDSGRSDSGRSDDRGRDDAARRAAEEKVSAAMVVAPLVPGFGGPSEQMFLEPILGFGPAAELMSVEVTAKDQKDAEETLRRYDRNNDGFLSGDEISSRWSGNPMDFDRNGDKKLSLSELAVRTARRRAIESSPEVAALRSGSSNKDRDRREKTKAPVEVKDPYNGRKSYLANAPQLPTGLPGWFAARDANGDMQVEMSEYADTWNDATVEEFNRFDLNGDGVVTVKECMIAVESGASASNAMASSSSPATSSTGSSMRSTSASPSSAPAPSGPSKLPAVDDEKLLSYAQKIISRYDKNGDGALTVSEWGTMLVDPSPADADKDGRITIPEYAAWMNSRSSR